VGGWEDGVSSGEEQEGGPRFRMGLSVQPSVPSEDRLGQVEAERGGPAGEPSLPQSPKPLVQGHLHRHPDLFGVQVTRSGAEAAGEETMPSVGPPWGLG
jgi:hypothetical protein